MYIKKFANMALLVAINIYGIQAQKTGENLPDTLPAKLLDEVLVSASVKETNDLKSLPAAVSIINPSEIENRKVITIKDLSTVVPNFYMPDYGSKLSAPVYIRGIGERSTGQSIGMYIDNMPLMDKAAFDFDLMDIRQIEVLRGPQGTLYGRNAMSGIVNITTRSPFESPSGLGRAGITFGNYGQQRFKVSVAEKASEKLGFALNLYGDRNDGYFTSDFSGKKADKLAAIGGNLRMYWKINPRWNMQLSASMDTCQQGAFPYGQYTNGKIASPNQNAPGKYSRSLMHNALNLQNVGEQILVNSNTAFQYLSDNMEMDNDYSPRAMFRLNQLQKEKSWTEELTVKSNTRSNYQWSFGLFGFYKDLKTNVLTTMDSVGIATILQPQFDMIHANNSKVPLMTVKNKAIPMPGEFKTPTTGGAIFHQSTYNNLFVDGLSLTAGIRMDYEKTRLDYHTGMDIDLDVAITPPPPAPPMEIHRDSTLVTTLHGKESMSFLEVLPKISVKYELSPAQYVYATVASGYKTGGYNIQMFADVLQDSVRSKYDRSFTASPVGESVPYKPEYSWNYEAGFKGELLKNQLYSEVAVFYTDVSDIQLTDFVASGQGRILKNAGKARSLGFDLSLNARLSNELSFSVNYGWTNAKFKDYKAEGKDFSGNRIPFAPQNTLSLSGMYNQKFNNSWVDRFHFSAQYNGAGRIYWTEANDVYQDFYGLLNVRTGVNISFVGINLWANNLLNSRYAVFYFESMGQALAQAGRPFTFGVDVNISF